MVKIQTLPFIKAQVICFLPAVIGGMATSAAIPTWYATLNKPTFNPPNSLFGPVWTVLYFLQGVSLYLLYITPTKDKTALTTAKVFFYIQLFLNLLWSLIFFGAKNLQLALIEIGLLIITVIFTLIATARINPKAAYLLIPYLMWITFAAYLNYSILILN